MAALTQTRWSSSPTSAPGSPWNVAMDVGAVGRASPVAQTPSMVGVALARQLQPTVYQQSMG